MEYCWSLRGKGIEAKKKQMSKPTRDNSGFQNSAFRRDERDHLGCGSASFSWNGPKRDYFRLCRPCSFHHNCSSLPLYHERCHSQYIHNWHGGTPGKPHLHNRLASWQAVVFQFLIWVDLGQPIPRPAWVAVAPLLLLPTLTQNDPECWDGISFPPCSWAEVWERGNWLILTTELRIEMTTSLPVQGIQQQTWDPPKALFPLTVFNWGEGGVLL